MELRSEHSDIKCTLSKVPPQIIVFFFRMVKLIYGLI